MELYPLSLAKIRYQQQYRQLQTMPRSRVATVVSYSTRDPVTGARILTAADGGEQYAYYLSNSVPTGTIATIGGGTIGLPGYVTQKPA